MIGCNLPSPQDLHSSRALRRADRIVAAPPILVTDFLSLSPLTGGCGPSGPKPPATWTVSSPLQLGFLTSLGTPTPADTGTSHFYTGHQAANLPVLLVAQSVVLDIGRQIGGLFWSADFPPQKVHILPPCLLSKSEASMCRPLREIGGGVDDLHCCVLKPRNSWSQQSVHFFWWATGQPLRFRRC